MSARYAIYFAPEQGSELEAFGVRWIGRCAVSGERIAQPDLPGLTGEALSQVTVAPRHYGFHGTLVPPFELAQGRSVDELFAHAKQFAADLPSFDLEPLSVREIAFFLALVPSGQEKVAMLAEACLRSFHSFRKPPSLAELEKRKAKGLTPNQERLLVNWWYPYVLDEFRFHITLTDSIRNKAERRKVFRCAKEQTAALCRNAHSVRELTIFRQQDRETPFTLVHRVPFGL